MSAAASPLYLYAIVDRRLTKLGRGIGGKPLRVLRVGAFWVVVEGTPKPAPTRAHVIAHDRVVRRAARQARAILPLRFGATVPGRDDLDALLGPLASRIPAALERVADAVQMNLRVSGPPAPPAPDDGAAPGPGTRYFERLRAKQRVPEIQRLTDATAAYVRASRAQRLEQPASLAVAYHLVPRDALRRWRAAVARSLPLLERGIEVKLSGPWPPYVFADLD